MSDIRQAAEWLSEGKMVARDDWSDWMVLEQGKFGSVHAKTLSPQVIPSPEFLTVNDLLADDWKIVEL